MPNPPLKLAGRRVILGLSGGVDSAVAALLLKRQGADVHALHMTNWEDDDGYCTAASDLQDARAICEQLGIQLHHVNFAREYRDRVFAYFLDEYRHGRTPNPDVLCNREIKFGAFRTYAHRLGGALLATGHYARVVHGDDGPELWKGVDANKDQSYFLHAIATEALAETVFPLGGRLKSEVRTIARDHGLVTCDKKDSTGICFIGERPFREFLSNYLPASPGPILTVEGQKIGEHQGLMYYTPGQRQGIGIGGGHGASDAPWYVADKELERNALIVVQGEHPLLFSDRIEVIRPSWIGAAASARRYASRFSCHVKIRYRQADQRCVVERQDGDRLTVSFENPQRAIAPGQFAVFYDGERCLGGGAIDRVLRDSAALRNAV